MSLAWVWFPPWIFRQGAWQQTIVMNSPLKLWSTVLPFCFLCHPPPHHPCLIVLPSTFFFCLRVMDWFSAVFSINAISHRSCPIPPQRHMCRDTDQRRAPHFQAMGLGNMQHKTRNGSLASDSYWCTVGLCVTEQADQHKQAHQHIAILTFKNDGTKSWGPYYNGPY